MQTKLMTAVEILVLIPVTKKTRPQSMKIQVLLSQFYAFLLNSTANAGAYTVIDMDVI